MGVDELLAAARYPAGGAWLAAAAADVDEAGQRRRMLIPAMPVLQTAEDVLQVDAVLEGLLELFRELADDRLRRLPVAVDVRADDLLRCDRRRRERRSLDRREFLILTLILTLICSTRILCARARREGSRELARIVEGSRGLATPREDSVGLARARGDERGGGLVDPLEVIPVREVQVHPLADDVPAQQASVQELVNPDLDLAFADAGARVHRIHVGLDEPRMVAVVAVVIAVGHQADVEADRRRRHQRELRLAQQLGLDRPDPRHGAPF